jgi:hypothetical protein
MPKRRTVRTVEPMKVQELKKIIDQYISDYKPIADYEIKLREYSEYGSFVELPITRVVVNIETGELILED